MYRRSWNVTIFSGGKRSSQFLFMELYHLRNDESSKRRKNNLYKDFFLFFCLFLFTDDYDFVESSAGSCSVTVGEGLIHIQGTVKEGLWGEMDCCSHGNRGNLPFALSLVRLCPPIHLWPSCASLTKTFGLEGGEGTETLLCLLCGLPFFFLLSLSCLGWKTLVWGFFAVFELVASAFLRAVSRLQVALPSLTSLFSNLKGI